jgi:hypothetical protein
MTGAASSLRDTVTRSGQREIGPAGTASRLVGGSIAIGVPIAVWGIGWWDVGASLIALPLIASGAGALVIAGYQRLGPEQLGRPHAICSGPTCVLVAVVIGAGIALTFVTPVNEVAIWVFLGLSMLLAAIRGYGGCEVLAFSNLVRGRRDQIGCMIFGPIDAAEAR